MGLIIVAFIGWGIIYLLSKSTGDSRSEAKAEFMLTSGLGFKGCGVILLIIIVVIVVLLVYVASLFQG